MSTDLRRLPVDFLSSPPIRPVEGTWLGETIKRELEGLSLTQPPEQWQANGCLLADMGDFIVRTTLMLSRLAENIVSGPQVIIYAQERLEKVEEENDFSELGVLDYLNEKHSSLKSLALRLQTTADELHGFWQASPSPPTTERRESSDPTTSLPSTVYRLPEEINSTATDEESVSLPWPTEQMPSSDFIGANQYQEDCSRSSAPTEPMPGAAVDPTTSLSSRGKGSYVCPHGTGCSKGGVKTDGDLVIFERNSAFRAHMQKHEKRFKCDLPGCSNTVGFARIDQLRRHQQVVKHRHA